MTSLVSINIGQIPIYAGYRGVPYNPQVLISMDKAKATVQEELTPFQNPYKVTSYVQAFIQSLAFENSMAYGRLLNDLASGRNVHILPGHRIYMFSGDPSLYMPNYQDSQQHTYTLQNPSQLKNYREPQYSLISHMERIGPQPINPSQTPPAAIPQPEKNWFDHAQTTPLPISHPKFDPNANNLSKASKQWTQISYSVLKKADDLSLTINSSISKYTGGLSLVIRATLVALGIIGFGLTWAAGHLFYVPVRALFSNHFGDYGINIGPIIVFMNEIQYKYPGIRINFETDKEPTEQQITALREHYTYLLQQLITKLNFHPDRRIRADFQNCFNRQVIIDGHPNTNIPMIASGPSFGIKFTDGSLFTVPNAQEFEHEFEAESSRLWQAVTNAFADPVQPPPAENWFDHTLSEPIPIFPKPADPIQGAGRLSSSSTKVTQAAHDVFTAFDGWAVSFDNATSKYLGALSLIGRAVLDLTGLVVGLGVLGFGHLIYVPFGAATGRDQIP